MVELVLVPTADHVEPEPATADVVYGRGRTASRRKHGVHEQGSDGATNTVMRSRSARAIRQAQAEFRPPTNCLRSSSRRRSPSNARSGARTRVPPCCPKLVRRRRRGSHLRLRPSVRAPWSRSNPTSSSSQRAPTRAFSRRRTPAHGRAGRVCWLGTPRSSWITVHNQRRAGDERRIIGSEEEDVFAGDLARPAIRWSARLSDSRRSRSSALSPPRAMFP